MNDLFENRPRRNLDGGSVIAIRGAREHNLKNVDLEIPRDRLVVFTGLSGSGKSSLAFDTIYAEGQRRYVESLSAYARQFLEMMQKPDVDQIDGLSPAISIEQKTTSKNPRSTVGTVTEIYDYMRLLWARVGIAYSPATGLPIESQTDIADGRPGDGAAGRHPALFAGAGSARAQRRIPQGTRRVPARRASSASRSTARFYEIGEAPALDKKFNHDIDVVVDRVVVRPDIAQRLAESFETALKLADGIAVVEFADAPSPAPRARGEVKSTKLATAAASDASRMMFSEKFACPVSGFTIPEIEPRLFSFNNPFGACPGLRRPWRRAEHRRRPRHSRPQRDAAQGRDRAVGTFDIALLHPDARGARQALQVHPRHQMEGSAEEGAGRDPARHPATTPSASSTTTACAPTKPTSRSRASSPTSSAASARPRANGRARS